MAFPHIRSRDLSAASPHAFRMPHAHVRAATCMALTYSHSWDLTLANLRDFSMLQAQARAAACMALTYICGWDLSAASLLSLSGHAESTTTLMSDRQCLHLGMPRLSTLSRAAQHLR